MIELTYFIPDDSLHFDLKHSFYYIKSIIKLNVIEHFPRRLAHQARHQQRTQQLRHHGRNHSQFCPQQNRNQL